MSDVSTTVAVVTKLEVSMLLSGLKLELITGLEDLEVVVDL